MNAVLILVLLLIVPMTSLAQDESLQAMVQQQQQLRADLAKGLDGVTPRQVRIIGKAQDEFFAATQGAQSLDQLSIQDKVRIENALETINAQIVNTSASRSDQDTCWREAKTGSRTKVTRCGTKEEVEQVRRDAQSAMEKRRICSGMGCG